MRIKKASSLLLGLVFVVGLVLLLFLEVRQNNISVSSVLPTPLPTPPTSVEKNSAISFYPNEPTGVVFTLNSANTLPSHLPFYFLVPTSTEEIRSATLPLTTTLGFSQEYKPVGLPGKMTNVWSTGEKTFTLSEKTLYYSYHNNAAYSPTITITTTQADEYARTFLNTLVLYEPLVLKTTSTQLITIDEGGAAGTSLFHIQYSILINENFPVIFSAKPEAISVMVSGDGQITSLSFPAPLKQITAGGPIALLPLDVALRSLNENKGTLLKIINPAQTDFLPAKPEFSRVNIHATSIAYYKNAETNTLKPVYIFEGTVETKDKTVLNVQYLLPATN